MKCIEVEEKIHELILGILGKDEENRILKHIEECENCRKIYERELRLEETLRKMPVVSPPLSLRYEILRRIETKRRFRVTPSLRWAPAFAAFVILVAIFLFFKGKRVDVLEASAFQIELVMPKEGATFFTDNVKIVATLFPERENLEIEAYLDEMEISHLFERKDGVLIYTPTHVEEGYHRVQIMVRDPLSGELKELESVFYTIGG